MERLPSNQYLNYFSFYQHCPDILGFDSNHQNDRDNNLRKKKEKSFNMFDSPFFICSILIFKHWFSTVDLVATNDYKVIPHATYLSGATFERRNKGSPEEIEFLLGRYRKASRW